MSMDGRVVVVGGCGHVGLPLAIVSALSGCPTTILDVDSEALAMVERGRMPFMEEGAEPLLRQVLETGQLSLSRDPSVIADCALVILVIGTPVNEFLAPRLDVVIRTLEEYEPHFRKGQTLILRSTVYPGVSSRVQRYFQRRGLDVDVAFCPERVAQGRLIQELKELPQIISAFSDRGLAAARAFFDRFAPSTVVLEPLEAELAKLFSNAYRYIQFATANQFYVIAEGKGLDYDRIYRAMTVDYPRLRGLPGPGFAAGPCLLKDTLQLAAYSRQTFSLGLAAVWVNEGLPEFIVEQAGHRCDLDTATVGILGMAFKPEVDDIRDSLSYKLRRLLTLEARRVLCHDPYVKDPSFSDLDTLVRESDLLIVATPHSAYRLLEIPAAKIVIDPWHFLAASGLRSAAGGSAE